ncbi:MAG: hypothetical protein J6R00_03955, partial [Lentisphaeria bacterium]|nr:hypothetical protein [Lentisphaeria bacterium]
KLFYLLSPTFVGNSAFYFYFFCASRLFWVSLCGAKLDFSVSLAVQARFWWETFVETKVLPPSPLSKELWVLI